MVCTSTPAAADLLAVAHAAVSEGWSVTLVADPQVQVPASLHAAVVVEGSSAPSPPSRGERQQLAPKRAHGFISRGGDQFREAGTTFVRGWTARARARALVAKHRPDVILVSTDRVVGEELAFLSVARRKGILCAVIPFDITDPDSLAHFRRDLEGFALGSLTLRFFERFLPSQVRTSGYGTFSFFRPLRTLVLAALGQLPPNPWTMGSAADVLFVSGERDRERSIEWGTSGEKIEVSGRPSLDTLCASLEDNDGTGSVRSSAPKSSPPVLVCAVPHLGEHGLMPWEEHLEHTVWLMDALAELDAAVVLSLHPKSDPAVYQPLAESRGLTISAAPLVEALPQADIYVATVSSTIRWAVLLGIPTVVVNHFGLDEAMFSDIDGLVMTRSKEDLLRALSLVVASGEERDRIANRLRLSATKLDRFDGSSSQRIVEGIASRLEAL